MQLADLANLSRYSRMYVSPHLDDAALSCGGAIAAAPADALVITLCTAAPPPGASFNAVAVEFHAEWGLAPAEVMGARLAEDAAAMAILGVDYYYAGMLDAIYRVPDVYDSRATLYRPPVPGDPMTSQVHALLVALHHGAPQATLYLPLGVGDHVDHLAVFEAAASLPTLPVAFYDDLNYALAPGAVEHRLALIGRSLVSECVPIDEPALRSKIAAIAAYASQMDALFGGVTAMTAAITAYHASLHPAHAGYAERVWRSA